jgi:PAS domain S-box-containing protein
VSLVDAFTRHGKDRLERFGVSNAEVVLVIAAVLLSGGIGPWVPAGGTFASIILGAVRTVGILWLPVRIGRRATAATLAILVYSYAGLAINGEVAIFGFRLVWVADVDVLTLGIGTSQILLSLVTTVAAMLILAALFAERRKTLREAKRSAERFRAITESTNDALIVTDDQRKIVFANRAADAMLFRRDLVGSDLDSLLPKRLRSTGASIVSQDRMHSDRVGTFVERADGHEIPVEVSIATYEYDGGSSGFTLVLRDQTERQRTEAELRRFAADLERSNQDLAEFAYIASHDLQEPLRMVASFLRLLEDRYKGQLDETADQFIGYAVEGAERLNALVSDLLRYSRAGTTEIERRAVDLSAATHEAMDMLRMQVRETGARIEIDPLPTVSGNMPLLTQVMQNLLSNAMKFQTETAPEIKVTWRASAEGPVVMIIDHGIGVPEDQRASVFQPFKRLHARDKFSGNGIGLSVCRKIIERHGGTIWLEDTPGGGTTVCFRLQPALRRIA